MLHFTKQYLTFSLSPQLLHMVQMNDSTRLLVISLGQCVKPHYLKGSNRTDH